MCGTCTLQMVSDKLTLANPLSSSSSSSSLDFRLDLTTLMGCLHPMCVGALYAALMTSPHSSGPGELCSATRPSRAPYLPVQTSCAVSSLNYTDDRARVVVDAAGCFEGRHCGKVVLPTTSPVTVPVTLLVGSSSLRRSSSPNPNPVASGGNSLFSSGSGVGSAGTGVGVRPGDSVSVTLRARSSPGGASVAVRAGVLGNLTAPHTMTKTTIVGAEWGLVGPFNLTIPAGAGIPEFIRTERSSNRNRNLRSGRSHVGSGTFQDSSPLQLVLEAGNPSAAMVWIDDVEVLLL